MVKNLLNTGCSLVYTFIGQGDASYTISFKTQGPTVNKLYYAAGGRGFRVQSIIYVQSTIRRINAILFTMLMV